MKLSVNLSFQIKPPANAMQLTTVMPQVRSGGYDFPQSNKDAPEVNTGEYVILYNVSSDTLNLGAYRLRNVLTNTSWTMTGLRTVAPGQRLMISNFPSTGVYALSDFKEISMVTDDQLREGDIRLIGGLGITLPDSVGSMVLEDTAGNLNDRLNYGEYFPLQAENAYVSTVNLDSLEKRAPLNAVYRTAGLSRPVCGSAPQVLVISTTGTLSGVPEISTLPGGYTGAESGSYALERGGKAYEFTNHLGNVLAILSDKKLGQDIDADTIADYYHPETMMLTDYYPFGMAMVGRSWQSGSYRYGFNGMQKDNEVVGEANAYETFYRMYDARLCRWIATDPQNQFPSAYSIFANSPLRYNDPLGDHIDLEDNTDDMKRDSEPFLAFLGKITGLNLTFDENGSMKYEVNGSIKEGDYSKSARSDLIEAIEGETGVILKNFSNVYKGHNVVYGASLTPRNNEPGELIFDLNDFSDDAPRYFDRGMVFIHELRHAYWGDRDLHSSNPIMLRSLLGTIVSNNPKLGIHGVPSTLGIPGTDYEGQQVYVKEFGTGGDVVDRVNVYRSELGLPLRINYYAAKENGMIYFKQTQKVFNKKGKETGTKTIYSQFQLKDK